MKLLTEYWIHRRDEIVNLAILTIILALACLASGWQRGGYDIEAIVFILIGGGMTLLRGADLYAFRCKLKKYSVAALTVLMASALACPAQTVQPPSVIPDPPVDGYIFNTELKMSLPDADPELAESPVLGAICFGVAVGVLGWLGVRAIHRCIDIHERLLTNRVANAPPPPTRVPSTNELVVTECAACVNSQAQPQDGDPLPVVIEHSDDGQHWTTISGQGIIWGRSYSLPERGLWRARVKPLRIRPTDGSGSGPIVEAPAGILESSRNLREWNVLGRHYRDVTFSAEPGTFYRVRL